jgi:hypothetical protein
MFTSIVDAGPKQKPAAADVGQLSKLGLESPDLILVSQLLARTVDLDQVFEVIHRLLVQNGVLLFPPGRCNGYSPTHARRAGGLSGSNRRRQQLADRHAGDE